MCQIQTGDCVQNETGVDSKTKDAIKLYQLIAEIETDNDGLLEVIEHCKVVLQTNGFIVSPTIADEYNVYLASMPKHNRYVYLAKRHLAKLTSGHCDIDKSALKREIIELYSKAETIKPLGKKDKRILDGLQKSV